MLFSPFVRSSWILRDVYRTLPNELLGYIMELADGPTWLSLRLSCRSLHYIAMKYMGPSNCVAKARFRILREFADEREC